MQGKSKKQARSLPSFGIPQPNAQSDYAFCLRALKGTKNKVLPEETLLQFGFKDLAMEYSKSKKPEATFPQTFKEFNGISYMPMFGTLKELEGFRQNQESYKAAYDKQLLKEVGENQQQSEDQRRNNMKRKRKPKRKLKSSNLQKAGLVPKDNQNPQNCSQIKQSQQAKDRNKDIYQPIPKKNYCQVCRVSFTDYKTHIQAADHKELSRESRGNGYLKDHLCEFKRNQRALKEDQSYKEIQTSISVMKIQRQKLKAFLALQVPFL